MLRNPELIHAGTRGNHYHHVVLYALNESPRIHRRPESILALPRLREEQKKTRTDRDMMLQGSDRCSVQFVLLDNIMTESSVFGGVNCSFKGSKGTNR